MFRYNIITLLILTFSVSGCKKYLDAKSDKKLVVITSLQDLQSILDYYSRVNQTDPGTPVAVSDDFYLKDANYATLPTEQKNLYIWNKANDFAVGYGNAWSQCYDNVYRANTVIFNMDKITRTPGDQSDWNNVKGQGYVLRAKSFLLASAIWSPAYESSSASTDLGIPLRLDPDFNESTPRSSLELTYAQIIEDLKTAINLLPVTPLHVLRSSKPSACALLARTYLWMRKYDSCFKYADLSLQMKNTLLDYNSVSASPSYPFTNFRFGLNPENVMDNWVAGPSLINNIPKMDSLLYKSYDANDLRKKLYFKTNSDGTYGFRGSYSGQFIIWDGIATDEIYLMRAECYARLGKTTEAIADLNTLLAKRWTTGTFTNLTANTSQDALSQILVERRKELIMRGLRWMDIKRLNKEGSNISPARLIQGQSYTLPANDSRFALPIPEDLVSLYGIKQNP